MLFVGDGHDMSATGFYFFDIADGLLEHGFQGSQSDDRNAFFDQGQGTMLQFTRSIGFRVNVGDFLELQRAFLSYSVIYAAADEEQVLVLSDLLGIGFNRVF